MGIGADMMESTKNLVSIGQGGLSLGNKDYYTKDDEATKKIREGFKQHIIKMFKLVGDNEKVATRKMESVMAIENKVAEQSGKGCGGGPQTEGRGAEDEKGNLQ